MNRVAGVVALTLLASVAGGESSDLIDARRRVKALGPRGALGSKIRILERVARFRESAATDYLLRRIQTRKAEPERRLTAWLVAEHVERSTAARVWDLAAAYPTDDAPWVQSRVLRRFVKNGKLAELEAGLRSTGPLALSALDALRLCETDYALSRLAAALKVLPTDPIQRYLRVCTVASVLAPHKSAKSGKAFTSVAQRLVEILEDKKTQERTRLNVARALADAYETKVVLDTVHWRRVIGFEALGQQSGNTVTARPTFGGIETAGRRIAYVLDMSTSMNKPHGGGYDTRFDVAYELLVQSIRDLPEDVRFAVIRFERKARVFRKTPRLVLATKRNKAAVLTEMRSLRNSDSAFASETNLHAGINRAFRMTERGLSRSWKPNDESTAFLGVDTIYLFTDGNPSSDDYSIEKDGKEFHGPFARTKYLIADIERMNFFRHVRIHCVGVGDGWGVLQRVAHATGGKARRR